MSADGWIDRWMAIGMDGWTDMDKRTEGWIDGWIDGSRDGWVDGYR